MFPDMELLAQPDPLTDMALLVQMANTTLKEVGVVGMMVHGEVGMMVRGVVPGTAHGVIMAIMTDNGTVKV